MNLEEKKELALKQDINRLLENMGYEAVKRTGNDVWYISPFNPNEKTASFHVSRGKINHSVWYDFSTRKSGNIINLVRNLMGLPYGKALDYILDHTSGRTTSRIEIPGSLSLFNKTEENDRFVLQDVSDISSPAIINYIKNERCIEEIVFRNYLKQVHFTDTKTNKSFYAAGIPNTKGGYEVNHRLKRKFKSAVPSGSKSISFFEGMGEKKKEVQVFSGLMDALSHIVYQRMIGASQSTLFEIDTVILNGDSLAKEGIRFIQNRGYEKVYGYFDNDESGEEVSKLYESKLKIKFAKSNVRFGIFNDYNEFICSKVQ